MPPSAVHTEPRRNLREVLGRLLGLRRIAVAAQGAVLFLAVGLLRLPLDTLPMLTAMGILALSLPLTRWRLTLPRPLHIHEITGQLVLDTLILGFLLYYAGGAANPFVSLLLIPVTLAASLLGAPQVAQIAALVLGVYSFLIFFNLPLPPAQAELQALDQLLARAGSGEAHAHPGFGLHVVGMWINFVLSVGVVGFFLSRMASALRAQENALAKARENELKHEQLLGIATLAASSAHQLGTPLSTLAVGLRELRHLCPPDPDVQDELLTLETQIDRCKAILQEIALAAEDQPKTQGALTWLRQSVDEWQLLRPRMTVSITTQGPDSLLATPRPLALALLSLLDNAADASPEGIQVRGESVPGALHVEIIDQGPGIDPDTAERLGEAFYHQPSADVPAASPRQRAGSLGIGYFLANTTIDSLGGYVSLSPRPDGRPGTCTRITIPLP